MSQSPGVYELRQYVLHPHQREVLIDVFDREFVESQEALGMRVVGQFRDLDDPDRFVWFRGFVDMSARREALTAFYGGPVWAAHKDTANPTMRAFDDVLLLRPVAGHDFGRPSGAPPRPGVDVRPGAFYAVDVYATPGPLGQQSARAAAALVAAVQEVGGASVAVLETEPTNNDYLPLPVREGEHVLVHVTRHDGLDGLALWQRSRAGRPPGVLSGGGTPTLRLSPTARSLLA